MAATQFGRDWKHKPRLADVQREAAAKRKLTLLLTRVDKQRACCKKASEAYLEPVSPNSYQWLLQHAKGIQRHYLRVVELSRPRGMLIALATPKWSDRSAVERVYRETARLSERLSTDFEVDHVVPITSQIVCGLHVHANLQVLTSSENQSKRNRYWPDMP